MQSLSPRLREIVHQSVALLGEVLRHELGLPGYRRIENLRKRMANLRGKSTFESHRVLQSELKALRALHPARRLEIARAFTLMLELMNACENAYRSHEIRKRVAKSQNEKPDALIYVFTAHPTEARAPENIWVFHEILRQLTEILERPVVQFSDFERRRLRHSLEIAWRSAIVRPRKPRVQDEAEHIFSTLLRDETLRTILTAGEDLAPVFLRSWVGGDKDGHPGVDEKVFLDSLRLSRGLILDFCHRRLHDIMATLGLLPADAKIKSLSIQTHRLSSQINGLRRLKTGDAKRVATYKKSLLALFTNYARAFGEDHPSAIELQRLLIIFPALVVPLEFRESSDVLMASPSGKGLAIYRMLQALHRLTGKSDPRDYVRGFIISMTGELLHLQTAAKMARKALHDTRLPVIPLFEQAEALSQSGDIVRGMIRDPLIGGALRKSGHKQLEIMLGYSDSSKESGVLHSRLQVAETMHSLEHLCRGQKVEAVFFQGSGGSSDRGGGSVSEQTAWWSSEALRRYKVTIQGEMVERSLANPDITRGQIEHIVECAGPWREARGRHLPKAPALDAFSEAVADHYRGTLRSELFLRMVQHATPYPFLDLLKFGSRPSKRSKKVSLQGLRAIPWVLCWTQTRVLFPTWWGIGHAWEKASPADRKQLIKSAKTHPLFATYVRTLGYTLAKIEPAVWDLYVEESGLSAADKAQVLKEFSTEHRKALTCAHALLGERKLIGWRPWLQESIHLRSPLIHPLNLLQLLAMQDQDVALLRTTVAGISSGMMTTG